MNGNHTLATACLQIVDCEHKTAPIDESGQYFAVGTPAMRGNAINYAEARRINEATFRSWTRRLTPRPGDLLFAREAPVGPIVRIPDVLNVAPGQRTVLLRPNPEVVDSDYLLYLLSSPKQQALIAAKAAGSTVAHLNVSDIRSFALPPLPSIREQQAAAATLRAMDDKTAANLHLASTADALAAALTRAALDLSNTAPLSEVASITMGASPPGTSYNEAGEGMVFYQGVRDFGLRFPENRVWTTAPARTAQPGDSLVSVRAPVGRLNLASEPTCIGRGLASVRSRFGTPNTLFHVLRDAPAMWAPFEAEGTVFGSISKSQLESLRIPLVGEQAESLERRLTALEARVASCLRENTCLESLREAVLGPLVSGDLAGKDATPEAGEVA